MLQLLHRTGGCVRWHLPILAVLLVSRAAGQARTWALTTINDTCTMLNTDPPAGWGEPMPATTIYSVQLERSDVLNLGSGMSFSGEVTAVTFLTTLIPYEDEDGGSMPATRTVVHTGITEIHSTMRSTFASKCQETHSSRAALITAETTYGLVRSEKAKHVPAAYTAIEDLNCPAGGGGGAAAAGGGAADPVCDELGFRTGCMGQCPLREDGFFACGELRFPRDSPKSGRGGRTCWGGERNNSYHQLLTPCLLGDLPVGCDASEGQAEDYAPMMTVRV